MSIKGVGQGPAWPQPTDAFAVRFRERAAELRMVGCAPQDAHTMLADDLTHEVNSVLKAKGKEAASDLVISVLENILENEDDVFYSRQLFVTCLEKINQDSRGLLSTDIGNRMLGYLYNNKIVGTESERSLLKRGVKTLVGHGFFEKMGLERYLSAHRDEMNHIDRTTKNVERVRRYEKFYHEEVEGIELSTNAHRRLHDLQLKVHALAEEPIMQHQRKAAVPPEGKTVRNPPPSKSHGAPIERNPLNEGKTDRSAPAPLKGPHKAGPPPEITGAERKAVAAPPTGYNPSRMPPFTTFFQDYRRRREAYMAATRAVNETAFSRLSRDEQMAVQTDLSEKRRAFEDLRPLLKNYSSREIRELCRNEYKDATPARQNKIDNMIQMIEGHVRNGAVYGVLNVFDEADEPLFEALFFCVADYYPKSVAQVGISAMKDALSGVPKKK